MNCDYLHPNLHYVALQVCPFPIRPELSDIRRRCPKSNRTLQKLNGNVRNRSKLSEIGQRYLNSVGRLVPEIGWNYQNQTKTCKYAVIGTLYTLQSILTTQGTHTIWSPSSRSLFEGRSEVLLSKSEIFF